MKQYTVEEAKAMTAKQRSRLRLRGFDVPKLRPGAPLGFKMSPDVIQKRKRFGPQHHRWKGDSAKPSAGRARARSLFKSPGVCSGCGKPGRIERHHVDGNTLNNSVENIQFLCSSCHQSVDGRSERFKEIARLHSGVGNAASAIARKSKTHCKWGHPFSGDNLLITQRGRVCLTCRRRFEFESKRRGAAK